MPEDPVILPSSTTESRTIGPVESPVVTVSQIPADLNVGDRVRPRANVKRADKTTNIEGVPVDFFLVDSLGTMALGTRVKTGADGNADATEYYYVGSPEAGLTVQFIVVTRTTIV